MRTYTPEQKERRRLYLIKYREAHAEELSVKKAAYYLANRDSILVKTKDYALANKELITVRGQRYRAANKQQIASRMAQYYRANSEKAAAYRTAYYKENRQLVLTSVAAYRAANPERVLESGTTYRKTHPHEIKARNARRRAWKLQATPAWANSSLITKAYALSHHLSGTLDIPHHVDHIVPLKSKLVCGLHVEFNLQVIPGAENCSKSNRYWPDMP